MKTPEVVAALSTLTKALESEPLPADQAMARLMETCARIEAKLDQLLATPAPVVLKVEPKADPVIVSTPTPTPTPTPAAPVVAPEAPKAEPKRARKAKAEEKPAEAPPASPAPEAPKPEEKPAEAPPACSACGIALNAENSSKRHSDGVAVHIGCPKEAPAPGDVEVLNVRQLKAVPAPAPEAPKAKEKPAEAPATPEAPTFEVLRQAALAHIQRHGKPSLVAALARFGAAKISELQDGSKAEALVVLNGPACAPADEGALA